MKIASIVLLMCFAVSGITAQVNKQIDSLKRVISLEKIDSLKVKQYYILAKKYIQAEDSASTANSFFSGILLAKKIKKHTLVVYGYNELGYLYELTGTPKTAITYYREAIKYANSYSILNEKARAFSNLGFVYSSLSDNRNSITAYDSALSIYVLLKSKPNIARNLNNLGAKHLNINNYEKALDYLNKAIIACDEIGDEATKAFASMNVGIINYQKGNYDIAMTYYKKAKASAVKINDINKVATINYNIATVLHDEKKYSQAVSVLLESLPIAEKNKLAQLYANHLNLLATCYRGINDDVNAKKYFLISLKEMLKQENNDGLVVNYGNYAGYLGEKKQYDSAIIYCNKALKIINTNKDLIIYKSKIYETLASCYKGLKDYNNAFNAQDSQSVYKELLINETSNGKLLELQTKYETVQKEAKISLLSKADSIKNLQIINQQLAINKNLFELSQQQLALAEDSILLFTQNETILQNKLDASLKEEKINTLTKEGLQKQLALQQQQAAIKQKNNTIIIIAIGAILLLVIAYAVYRKKQLQQQAFIVQEQAKQREQITKAVIDAEEAERKRIASDLHDGVGQLFSAVKMNLAGLIDRIDLPKQEDQFLAEKTLALVDESCKEVRVISHKMMPNFLLKSGIASDIRSFIEKIDESTLKIHFETKGFKEQLEFNEEVILYRVIQELIGNVIKHAQANELYLHLEKTDKQIQVQVTDNGLGFNYNNAKAKGGLGLKNILVRIEYLKGTISFTPNQPTGTAVKISIPIA